MFRRLYSRCKNAAVSRWPTRQSDHITPVLRQLQWLPECQRVDFKLAVLVYKALHDLTAPYLVADCQLIVIVSNVGRRGVGHFLV